MRDYINNGERHTFFCVCELYIIFIDYKRDHDEFYYFFQGKEYIYVSFLDYLQVLKV